MDRKRKLPPRAAAQISQAAKRRTSTPPVDSSSTTRSGTPTPTGGDDGVLKRNAQSHNYLPKSVQAGKPLPTVDKAQPSDLPASGYQTVQERQATGVLSESLTRSRLRWINEGIFDKYWSKPSKRRGVAIDDPKNPPKDSMVKLGQAIIFVEPHTFEVTLYGVKDPKPAPALPATRPVLMYGPSRGMMPPPPLPSGSATTVQVTQATSRPPTPKIPPASPVQMPAATPLQNRSVPVSTPQKTAPEPLQATPQPQRPEPESAAQEEVARLRAETPMQAPPVATAPTTPQRPLPLQSIVPSSQNTPPPVVPLSQPPPETVGHVGKEEPPRGLPPTRPATLPMNTNPLLSSGAPPAEPVIALPPTAQPPATGPSKNVPSRSATPSPGMAPSRQPSVPPQGSNPSTPARPPIGPSPSPPAREEGSDSIIYALAGKASSDPVLRDLMTRVAGGTATKEDLNYFQTIIDQISEEKAAAAAAEATPVNAAPHQLFVDGRSVLFFAEEVRTILDIVLRSNPQQMSFDLQPPVGSDPLVVELVKTALDNKRVRDIISRIGMGRPLLMDARELKVVLDGCMHRVSQNRKPERLQRSVSGTPGVPASVGGQGASGSTISNDKTTTAAKENEPDGGQPESSATAAARLPSSSSVTPVVSGSDGSTAAKERSSHGQNNNHQGSQLRSKGPPPPLKLELSAVVVEFVGGTGDRYLFPRFSILEYTKSQQGHPEVIASFLLVRKGSVSEYGGDPDLDYYQPITIRIRVAAQSANQKVLDYLARVVAPADEVRRYMDNIMSTMTRAEYLLLAMRLPRRELGAADGGGHQQHHHADDEVVERRNSRSSSYTVGQPQPMKGVLWTATVSGSMVATPRQKAVQRIVQEDQQYQNFISSLLPKDVDN